MLRPTRHLIPIKAPPILTRSPTPGTAAVPSTPAAGPIPAPPASPRSWDRIKRMRTVSFHPKQEPDQHASSYPPPHPDFVFSPIRDLILRCE
jgi:hypothetical protein